MPSPTPRRSAQPRHLQHRLGRPVHQHGLHGRRASLRHPGVDGRQGALGRNVLIEAPVALPEMRGCASARAGRRAGDPPNQYRLDGLLQRLPAPLISLGGKTPRMARGRFRVAEGGSTNDLTKVHRQNSLPSDNAVLATEAHLNHGLKLSQEPRPLQRGNGAGASICRSERSLVRAEPLLAAWRGWATKRGGLRRQKAKWARTTNRARCVSRPRDSGLNS